MADFHLLRPWWLLAILPLIGLCVVYCRQTPRLIAWAQICDSHLLDHLVQGRGQKNRFSSFLLFFLSMLFLIISLTGPTWYKLPTASYKPILPRVLVLDMSESMMEKDLTPDRLTRAKFKIRDLLTRKASGQFGLLVFTGEPFVVSPLTDDGQTISSLLSSLTPKIMPVGGQKLDAALGEAQQLILQAGFRHGEILVLTADSPSSEAMEMAKKLADKGIYSSIMPIKSDKELNPLFQRFANSGGGILLRYTSNSSDIQQWLNQNNKEEFALGKEEDISLWRDEGRWFLIPALLFLLPLFQRGSLQRFSV